MWPAGPGAPHAPCAADAFSRSPPLRPPALSPHPAPAPPLSQQSNAAGLVVISEEDTRTLLIHRISADAIYVRSGGEAEGGGREGERGGGGRWRAEA